jgi:rRNA-processing protein FCF1
MSTIRLADLENCQPRRKKEGRADNTIDREIGTEKTMVLTAFDKDMIGQVNRKGVADLLTYLIFLHAAA